MLTVENDVVVFVDGTVAGEFSGCVDASAGGYAMATFNDGFLAMHLDGSGGAGQYVDMTVSLKWLYSENETTGAGDPTTHLNGRAVVKVEEAFFSDGWLSGGLVYEWADAVGDLSGLLTETTLPYGMNIPDFLLDYSTDNTIITLLADERFPEPMTLAFLGVGAIFLARKRRA